MLDSLKQYIRTRSWMSIIAFLFALASVVFAVFAVWAPATYLAVMAVFSVLVSYRED
jgi:hypothetical protein